jgi:hypothetical protein
MTPYVAESVRSEMPGVGTAPVRPRIQVTSRRPSGGG